MRSALLQLGEDFLSTIVFLVLFLATGNLVLVQRRGPGLLISAGAVGAKVIAFLLQFVVLRMLVRRRMRPTIP